MLTLFILFRPACVVVSDLQIYSSAQGKVLLALVSAFSPSPLALLLEKRERIKKGEEDFCPPGRKSIPAGPSLRTLNSGLEFELPDLLLDIAVSLKAKKKENMHNSFTEKKSSSAYTTICASITSDLATTCSMVMFNFSVTLESFTKKHSSSRLPWKALRSIAAAGFQAQGSSRWHWHQVCKCVFVFCNVKASCCVL